MVREYLFRAAEWAGLEGVSIVALVTLVTVVVWSSRAKHAGSMAGTAVGTTRWIAVTLGLLAVAGVVSIHPDRAVELAAFLREKAPIVARWITQL